ncbi:hypothetical protein ACGO3R_02220 [Lactococcus lactis]
MRKFNEKIIFLADVILRLLFMVLAWYVYTNYSADNKMKWVGLSMVAFNIITMFLIPIIISRKIRLANLAQVC